MEGHSQGSQPLIQLCFLCTYTNIPFIEAASSDSHARFVDVLQMRDGMLRRENSEGNTKSDQKNGSQRSIHASSAFRSRFSVCLSLTCFCS